MITLHTGMRVSEILGLTWNTIDFRLLQELLGHSTVATILELYSHITQPMKDLATAVLESIMPAIN